MYGALEGPNTDLQRSARDIRIPSEKKINSWKLAIFVLCVGIIVLLGNRANGETEIIHLATNTNQDYPIVEKLNNHVTVGLQNGVRGSNYPFIVTEVIAEPQKESSVYIDTGSLSGDATCAWSVEFVRGGGVWDSIPGVVVAKKFSPFGSIASTSAAPSELKIFRVTFPSPGDYEVNVTCLEATVQGSGNILKHNAILPVKCMYVRRELRMMTDSDRNAFLDTFITLSQTHTVEGVQKYGINYRSLVDFEVMHLKAAGNRRLDHIHDGMGIITQHVSMTNEFELALQSVNPAVAVPYWDFTIDAAKITLNAENGTGLPNDIGSIFRDSEIFTKSFFGKTESSSHRVEAGRFANMTLPRDYNFSTRSAYGFLRAPWNVNPNIYVTRYHSFCGISPIRGKNSATSDYEWPSCETHFRVTNTESFSSWFSFVWDIGYMPHGPVHSWIGGVGGECDNWSDFEEKGYLNITQIDSLKKNSFVILKNAYRSFVVNPPSFCAADTPVSDCKLKCSDPNSTNTLSLFDNEIPWWDSVTTENQKMVSQKVFCETAFWPGDHLEAASPIEASFWPIHPTLERLLQYKDLTVPFTSSFWTNETSEVCLYSESDCKGHHPGDLTFWKTVVQEKSGSYASHHLTNAEVREAILPRSGTYAVPYIYDSFEWDHCRELGVHFKAAPSL